MSVTETQTTIYTKFGQNNQTLVPFVIFLLSYSSLSPKNPEKVDSHDQARTAVKMHDWNKQLETIDSEQTKIRLKEPFSLKKSKP